MKRLTPEDARSPYATRMRYEDVLDDGKGPMQLRPQAFNSRDLRMPCPQQVSSVNQLFNRAGGNMRASGMVLTRSDGEGVRKNLGW